MTFVDVFTHKMIFFHFAMVFVFCSSFDESASLNDGQDKHNLPKEFEISKVKIKKKNWKN